MANPGPNIVQSAMNLSAVAPGTGKVLLPFYTLLASLADADMMTNFPLTFKGRILAVDFITNVKAATASKACTLTTKIVKSGTTTPMTGGVVALTTAAANTAGLVAAGTPVTALNSFNAGDGLTITGSGTTAFAEGSGWIIVTMVNDDLLDALARSQLLFNP